MSDGVYVSEAEIEDKDRPGDWATTKIDPSSTQPAEFMRLGEDIFTQRNGVTNYISIQWMQRTIGDDYWIHILDFQISPQHIWTQIFIRVWHSGRFCSTLTDLAPTIQPSG